MLPGGPGRLVPRAAVQLLPHAGLALGWCGFKDVDEYGFKRVDPVSYKLMPRAGKEAWQKKLEENAPMQKQKWDAIRARREAES